MSLLSGPLRVLLFLAVSLVLSVATRAAVKIVQLKGGATLTATVIAETPERIVVDLGYRIVDIPTEEVVSSRAIEATNDEDDGAATVETSLFTESSGGRFQSVRNHVKQVGASVVQVSTPSGMGSGFFISEEGYLITNQHVVAGEQHIEVTRFQTGGTGMEQEVFENVRIISIDANLDLALLKIESEEAIDFRPIPIGDSVVLEEGQPVFAIGSPLGLDRTVSEGIISLKNRAFAGQLYLQTTTQINPGNSGGPLFNLRGEVVGVNNMKAMMAGVEGLSFAIPADVLKTFLRNREAFSFDPRNPNNGFRYFPPPRPGKGTP